MNIYTQMLNESNHATIFFLFPLEIYSLIHDHYLNFNIGTHR